MGSRHRSNRQDFWPVERQGYSDAPRVAYAAARVETAPGRARTGLSAKSEARAGTIIAVLGIIWAVHAALAQTTDISIGAVWLLPRGPLELAAIGGLVWLHAKWRRWATQY